MLFTLSILLGKLSNILNVHLSALIDKRQKIINSDKIIHEKLSQLHENLKSAANSNKAVPQEGLNQIFKELQETILYAKDMAEEEQRMTSENMTSNENSESAQSDQYFSLATDLEDLEKKVRKIA